MKEYENEIIVMPDPKSIDEKSSGSFIYLLLLFFSSSSPSFPLYLTLGERVRQTF